MKWRFCRLSPLVLAALMLAVSIPAVCGAESKIPKELLEDVRSIGLQRGAYTLGVPLTGRQAGLAAKSPLPSTAPGTFRFRDGELQVVAEEGSNIVLAISEYHPDWTRKKVKDLIGSFTLGFGFPTTSAHGKTLYWFYSADGKLLEEGSYKDYVVQHGRESIIATIKIQTGEYIFGDKKGQEKDDQSPDTVYYIIYSNPMLEFFLNN